MSHPKRSKTKRSMSANSTPVETPAARSEERRNAMKTTSMRNIVYGGKDRVLLRASELESKGYTRAESEATRGPQEYFLAYHSSKGNQAEAEKKEGARMILVWDSDE